MNVLSFLSVLEPSTSEVCSVESFRAALGTSCSGAIAVINAIGKYIDYNCTTTTKIYRNGEIKYCVLRFAIFETVAKQRDGYHLLAR